MPRLSISTISQTPHHFTNWTKAKQTCRTLRIKQTQGCPSPRYHRPLGRFTNWTKGQTELHCPYTSHWTHCVDIVLHVAPPGWAGFKPGPPTLWTKAFPTGPWRWPHAVNAWMALRKILGSEHVCRRVMSSCHPLLGGAP